MAATRSNQVGGSDYTSGANREDLKQGLHLVSADQTPLLSSIGTTNATNTRHEWATQSLATPVTTAVSTSYEFATANATNQLATRISNYAQVFGKTIHIDGLQMKSMDISSAKNWFENTAMIRRKEIRRDVETKMLAYDQFNAAASTANVYTTGDTPSMASLNSYAGTFVRLGNDDVKLYAGTDAASAGTAITTTRGTAVSILGTTNAAAGSHTVRYEAVAGETGQALTETHLTSLQQVASDNGGVFTHVMVPSRLKKTVTDLLISGSGGAAQRRAEVMSTRVAMTVDSVLTDFFDLKIMRNYLMGLSGAADADSMLYMYNSGSVKRAIYQADKLIVDQSARFGKGGIVICAETLEVAAPNDVGMIMTIT